jgi:hypothetical protein
MILRPFVRSTRRLCECHRPFCLPRPATASTTMPKRELPFANPVSELDASDRGRRVRERLEPGHRRTAPLDRAVVLFNQIV